MLDKIFVQNMQISEDISPLDLRDKLVDYVETYPYLDLTVDTDPGLAVHRGELETWLKKHKELRETWGLQNHPYIEQEERLEIYFCSKPIGERTLTLSMVANYGYAVEGYLSTAMLQEMRHAEGYLPIV